MNKPLSVLLVDDDKDTRRVFEIVMNHNKFDLNIVNDAESCVRYLKETTPDVIVMDIILPGIDGLQAMEQIRNNLLAPKSVFIATTAYYTSDTRTNMLDRGFDGFLPKPLNPSTLGSELTRLVEAKH